MIQKFKGNKDQFLVATCSPDDKWVLTGGQNGIVTLWDVASGREAGQFVGHTSKVVSLCFLEGGSMFVSGSADSARLWDRELWDREAKRPLCSFFLFNNRSWLNSSWAIVDSSGRFDTDSLEDFDFMS